MHPWLLRGSYARCPSPNVAFLGARLGLSRMESATGIRGGSDPRRGAERSTAGNERRTTSNASHPRDAARRERSRVSLEPDRLRRLCNSSAHLSLDNSQALNRARVVSSVAIFCSYLL